MVCITVQQGTSVSEDPIAFITLFISSEITRALLKAMSTNKPNITAI